MELREVLKLLRAAWWMVLTGLVMGAAAGLSYSLLQTPVYSSSTQLFVANTEASATPDALPGGQFSLQRVASYAQLINGPDMAARVVGRLNLEMSPEEVSQKITATPITDTVLIDVTVTDSSPQRAQRIAEAAGAEFAAYAWDLERAGSSGVAPVKVKVTKLADLPVSPSSPQTHLNVGIGLLVGAVAAGALVITRARLDHSVKEPDDASHLANAPVIGVLPRDDVLRNQHALDFTSDDPSVRQYRRLQRSLQFLDGREAPGVIMVSSAATSQGKTTLVVNLALALRDAGRKVTVVEADLRRPKTTRYLGLTGDVGLTNILAGAADPEEAIRRHRDGLLSVIPAGPTPPNPEELLASSHMASLLERLRAQNDCVLVDAPPILEATELSILAGYTDGVLLSARYGRTRREELQQAAELVDRVGAKILGVVLTMVPPRAAALMGYGYEGRSASASSVSAFSGARLLAAVAGRANGPRHRLKGSGVGKQSPEGPPDLVR